MKINNFNIFININECLTIIDLARKISEDGYDFDAIRHILSNDYKYEGDEGVINAAKELGFRIEAMGKGRYVLK